jgi:hypothetical protein
MQSFCAEVDAKFLCKELEFAPNGEMRALYPALDGDPVPLATEVLVQHASLSCCAIRKATHFMRQCSNARAAGDLCRKPMA